MSCIAPERMPASPGLIPAARTSTTTSPGPASGMSMSATYKTPPGPRNGRTVRHAPVELVIFFSLPWPNLRALRQHRPPRIALSGPYFVVLVKRRQGWKECHASSPGSPSPARLRTLWSAPQLLSVRRKQDRVDPAWSRRRSSASVTGTLGATPDYSTLLIKASDIGGDFTRSPTARAEPQQRGGRRATVRQPDNSRRIGDTILIVADPVAAAQASTTPNPITRARSAAVGGRRRRLQRGDDSGTSPDNSQAITVLLFTEGKALVDLEFDSAPSDPIDTGIAKDVGRKQDAAIKKGYAQLSPDQIRPSGRRSEKYLSIRGADRCGISCVRTDFGCLHSRAEHIRRSGRAPQRPSRLPVGVEQWKHRLLTLFVRAARVSEVSKRPSHSS